IRLSQRFGIPIDANIFVGCSPIRQYVEEWDIQHILKLVKNSVSYAVKNNLPVCFITEDTTRSNPNDLGKIYQTAVECGAYRLCIADTVGYIIPQGVRNLIRFVKSVLVKCGKTILLDWHGHNDRGLALANALTALEEGVNRLHATALSIGERTGNTSMEQLLMNLKLLGLREFDSTKLRYYTILVSEACGFPIPINQPIVGDKAYTTATGVHAAAIIKAKKMNDDWLADRIYSSIPAQELGLNQKIEIGPMSGKANVKYFLEQNNINDPRLVDWILSKTKSKGESLTDGELSRIFEECGIKILYNQ
ncbi:MAG: 2-isopropylmalate synthase, partial [Acidobacteria bacterium]|nr:2-isopropylmalate synthase [Acidobacteriota bacterium]